MTLFYFPAGVYHAGLILVPRDFQIGQADPEFYQVMPLMAVQRRQRTLSPDQWEKFKVYIHGTMTPVSKFAIAYTCEGTESDYDYGEIYVLRESRSNQEAAEAMTKHERHEQDRKNRIEDRQAQDVGAGAGAGEGEGEGEDFEVDDEGEAS